MGNVSDGVTTEHGHVEFDRLLELAQAAAHALRSAGVAAQSPALAGWLVIQRLDRLEVVHPADDDGTPRREDALYEQIWLTTGGGLVHARRAHRTLAGGGPDSELAPEAESSQLGSAISSESDLVGRRWDGDYGPRSQRNGCAETIVYDDPRGPREHPASRIARALASMSTWLIKDQSPAPPVTAPTGLATILAMGVGMVVVLVMTLAGAAVAAFMLYAWFMGVAAGGG